MSSYAIFNWGVISGMVGLLGIAWLIRKFEKWGM